MEAQMGDEPTIVSIISTTTAAKLEPTAIGCATVPNADNNRNILSEKNRFIPVPENSMLDSTR